MSKHVVLATTLVNIPEKVRGCMIMFDGSVNLKDRHRSLQLSIVNNTPFSFKLAEATHFDSGTSITDPAIKLLPASSYSWFVANKEGSFMTGVSGSVKYEIAGSQLAIYIGFCNPQMGSFKHFIAVEDRQLGVDYGYEQCSDDKQKFFSQAGFYLTAEKQPSEIAHQHFLFTISQNKK